MVTGITMLKFFLIFFFFFGCVGSWLRHAGSFSLWCMGSFLRCVGFSLVVVCEFSLSSCGVWAPECMGSVVCNTRTLWLRCVSSVVAACRLSCPMACGILVPRPGIEPASLHWKVDSLPLDHQGSPLLLKFYYSF